MTFEELCHYVPYNISVRYDNEDWIATGFDTKTQSFFLENEEETAQAPFAKIKPYMRDKNALYCEIQTKEGVFVPLVRLAEIAIGTEKGYYDSCKSKIELLFDVDMFVLDLDKFGTNKYKEVFIYRNGGLYWGYSKTDHYHFKDHERLYRKLYQWHIRLCSKETFNKECLHISE